MAVSLKHSFNNPKSDGPDSTVVRPSDWNAEHVLTLGSNRVLGRVSSGTGAVEELTGTQVRSVADVAQLGVLAGINTRTASYTLVAADRGKLIEMNVSGANTLTVPNESGVGGVNFPIGTQILVVQTGAGTTTLAPAAGVTVQSTTGGLSTVTRYAAVLLYKRAANSWIVIDQASAHLDGRVDNLETVAGGFSNVAAVATNIASVNTTAANIYGINAVAQAVNDGDLINDFYVGASSTDPATRLDSSALQNGDFYFNTVSTRMRTYASGSWYDTGSGGNTDAALVTFSQSGTGAVARTVQAKLRDFVNVKDFGAAGDNVTNDTTAFNNALATGKAVYVPQGNYRVNITLAVGNRSIFGDGMNQTYLRPHTAANPVIKIDGDALGNILQNTLISDLTILGDTRQGDGIQIYNTADTRGCDQIILYNVTVMQCLRGIACLGRSIWNMFENVFCDFNYDGIFIQTNQACNLWTLVNVRTARNQRHGFYANKTDLSLGGFLQFTFLGFNTEYNGQDTSIPLVAGLYTNAAEGWNFQNVGLEDNGADLPGVTSYGMYFTGNLGRGVIIDGVWGVNSKYIIAFDGTKKSGYINNVYRGAAYAGGYVIHLVSEWANNEPKIELGPNIFGTVNAAPDANANYPHTAGVDWYGAATTSFDFTYRKRVTINTTSAASSISTLTGLRAGDEIFIYNYAGGGTNKITLASGLMASGVAYDVNPDTGAKLIVTGYPHTGKLVPL